MTIRILIKGAVGRMGTNLVKTLAANPNTTLAYAVVHAQAPELGKSVPEFPELTYITDLKEATDFDVAIDFTSPSSTLETLAHCQKLGKPLVIGTTGLSNAEKEQIKAASKDIPIVFAANFSVGMNLMFKLVEKAAKVMGEYSDIEIIEAHHHHKVDAPSGTALALGEHICKALDRDLEQVAVKERNGLIGPRTKEEIGFSTIRAADVIGEHTVWFADIGERVELSHRVSDRITFARGAVHAALWLAQGQEANLYDMTNVLGLDKI
ncbi:4-hydroxy-tetrahydrodipicolinate reductase [Psittacicella gerlachiana]|uniref:4-hydroxy-tetrahydrodipicolinate reductase n=1 Tax=Psittacicella gerlachiana TaxID=2028574 RepID=A0A3A1YLR3_9GAMM|nr:4-hydroxy-tetrahydrodipicolinate reductase [Psittacicella gerlachiana]RIY38416.1 4-hydroxy-tetrahydrodipicolinate reductase [Psittacicella gerlachiana]